MQAPCELPNSDSLSSSCGHSPLTSTIVVLEGDKPRVSVKTKSNIPKSRIVDCMKEIDSARVKAPVKIGDILIKNVCDTGVDIVATRNIEKI